METESGLVRLIEDRFLIGKNPEEIQRVLSKHYYFRCPRCNGYFCKTMKSVVRHLEEECEWDHETEDLEHEDDLLLISNNIKKWHRSILRKRSYESWFNESGGEWEPLLNKIEDECRTWFVDRDVFVSEAEVRYRSYVTMGLFYELGDGIQQAIYQRYWTYISHG